MQDIQTQTDVSTPVAPYKVDPHAGGHDGTVSTQWMSRPHDQRFLSLNELHAYKEKFWRGAFQTRTETKEIEILAPELKSKADAHALTVGVKLDTGSVQEIREIAPTHYAFGQLCGLAKAPAAYLRELPSQLVTDQLNYRLRFAREIEEIKLYGGKEQLYAATGPDYGRIPDYEVVEAVRQVAGNGRGERRWKIPGVVDWSTHMYNPEAPVTKESTTLYASDRDLFIFLVDDRNPIEIGKLQDGSPDLVFRGFYVQNSEMGARSLKLAAFYLRAVCMNRNLWGVEGFQDLTIRHTRLAPDRWLQQAVPALNSYANGSQMKLIEGVKAAKDLIVASNEEDALEFLRNRKFGAAKSKELLERGLREEGRPPRSAWDMAQCLTADARDIPNTDDRLGQELEARRILELAA